MGKEPVAVSSIVGAGARLGPVACDAVRSKSHQFIRSLVAPTGALVRAAWTGCDHDVAIASDALVEELSRYAKPATGALRGPLIKCQNDSRVCLKFNLMTYVAFDPLGHDLAERLCAESDDRPAPPTPATSATHQYS